jgi:hypothetical protein
MKTNYSAKAGDMSSTLLLMPFARLLLAATIVAAPGQAAFFRRAPGASSRPGAITLRKRLHVNTLITPPGEMEVEWGGAVSTGDAGFTLPAAVKYTPEGPHIWWGRTEFSATFDSLASAVQFDNRITQFSDRLTFAGTCVLHDGAKLDLAIAPLASFLLRGDTGARLGATGIARYDAGRSSAGVSLTWTAATDSSPSNPAGTFDIGAGYGYRLTAAGPLSHLTPHANWLYEKSTRQQREISIFEGVEYQVTEKVSVDFSGQHFSVWGGTVEHQIAVGLTFNVGRLRREKN